MTSRPRLRIAVAVLTAGLAGTAVTVAVVRRRVGRLRFDRGLATAVRSAKNLFNRVRA